MPERKLVAIHQPNFFPWLGYFNKLAVCDRFVVLDNVQFPKTGGTWSNRVQVAVAGRPAWITMPIVRNYHGVRTIGQMQIHNARPWRDKLLATIRSGYTRSPFFGEVFPVLTDLMNKTTESLVDYNLNAIMVLANALRIDTAKIRLGSTLGVEGVATALLVATVRAVGGTAYLCGGGAEGYQEDEAFAAGGIELIYQNFSHPTYHQVGFDTFVPGLSIIDALMNCGFEGTRKLVRSSQPAH